MSSNNTNKQSLTPGDLTWDRFIYPRGAKSQKTISAYVEALDIGAKFPPIKVQRVFNYTDEQGNGNPEAVITVIVDGIHRWSAFKEKGLKEIETIEFKNQPIDYQENKTALLLESAKCNTSHGDRLSPNDKKRIARDIASSDPECRYTELALAEKLGVSQQTVNAWITDIRARQKTNRDSIIIRLSRLGWTQEKIAETTKMTQGRVAQI
ncbi:MAG: MerR family transcriptional regulator, partial [Desulfobacula sp.]|nr:MerR family transcriptional regulator [Desulfobacula sp.]